MSEKLQKYLLEPAPALDGDYITIQRQTLAEILRLDRHNIEPIEKQINSIYRGNTADAAEKSQKACDHAEATFQTHSESARQNHEQTIANIKLEYQTQLKKLETQTHAKRDQIISDTEARLHEVKQNCDYEIMTAENIAEGKLKKYQLERLKIKEAVTHAHKKLDNLCQTADAVPQNYYGQTPESDPLELPDPTDLKNYHEYQEQADNFLYTLHHLWVPRLFIGIIPYAITLLICSLMIVLAWLLPRLISPGSVSFYVSGPAALLLTLGIIFPCGKTVYKRGRQSVYDVHKKFQHAIACARLSLEEKARLSLEEVDEFVDKTHQTRDHDLEKWQNQFEQETKTCQDKRTESLTEIDNNHQQSLQKIEQDHRQQTQAKEQEHQQLQQKFNQQHEQQLQDIQQKFDTQTSQFKQQHDESLDQLNQRIRQSLNCLEKLIEQTSQFDRRLITDFCDAFWNTFEPSSQFNWLFKFAHIEITTDMLAPSVLQRVQNIISLEKPLELPALLSFPRSSSLLLQTGHAGREQTLKALRSIMVRLFVSLPPGRVNFTIIDPVGLGENFAGFMHAADHHEALVGRRIWTEPAHISQQLTQLTEHMENVIQKYLRNEFETIEQYNQQAGELAEPYRFLVVADFPANFDEQSAQRLTSIINSGPRCGVYTLIMYDDRRELPVGFNYEDLCSGSVHVVCEDGRFCRRDIVWQNFPLRLDTPPTEDTLTDIMNKVGSWTKDACRVEIPFQSIAPGPDEHWSLQSDKAIKVPIGRTGATRLQYLELGKGMAQHMLTAGKTGSGKSTLLHVIISNLALWYSPEELHLHLIDFKRGVEFKTYVKNKLPHARTVAIESDREFGLSILQKLDAEMARRGQLFRQAHAQDIASYRQVTGEKLPRSLLIVDEFQVFFGEDDRIAQEAAVLLEQLVRQGRAFGVHVILGSQTLAGASGLARSTMGQMAVRIALQCSEADSQIILDDNNLAARLLSRPGEAIYNDAGGMIAGNSPFQTAWLSDEIRDKYLEKISQWSQKLTQTAEPMVVFEGNIPAELSNNQILINLFKQPAQSQNATAFLGEPLAVKSPTSVTFNRQSGANLLILGQRETSALGLISSSLISLTAALTNPAAEFIVMENLPVSTEAAESLVDYAKILPSCRTISYQQTSEAIEQLAHEVRCRTENNNKKFKTTFLVINGLHRYRNLRRSEDDFSFSTDSDAPPKPDKLLAEILREGPLVGIHCIIWIDTLVSLERLFDRATLREFDMRVLFQMSSANSSNLIDSPQANNLGLHRALLYDEEHGKLEKFRPYRSPKPDWTKQFFE